MKIEPSAYKITLDSGQTFTITAAEHDELANHFGKDDSLPLPYRTANSPSIYMTQSPIMPDIHPADPTSAAGEST